MEQLVEMEVKDRNDLPDSCFLHIKIGGSKDETGKTVPRDLRMLPYKKADGSIDISHLRNAISRLSQEAIDIPAEEKARLLEKARKLLDEYNKENMSSKEDTKMESKDQLGKTTPEVKADEPKVEVLEVKVQEQLSTVQEQPAKVEEQPVKVEPAQEALSQEIKTTEKELQVIKEVRDELVAVYAKNKELETEKESLSKQLSDLKKDMEGTKEKLSRYEKAEQEYLAKKKQEKLEQLSRKFTELGQTKSVERLSKLDDATVSEFESIVDAALNKAKDATPLPSVTTPTQCAESLKKVEKPKEQLKAKVQPEKSFFAGLCKTMTNAQTSGKKVSYM